MYSTMLGLTLLAAHTVVKADEPNAQDIAANQRLSGIYSSIWNGTRNQLRLGQHKIDERWKKDAGIRVYSLDISIRIVGEPYYRLALVLDTLKRIEPAQYCLDPEWLHITILLLDLGDSEETEPAQLDQMLMEKYGDILSRALAETPKFEIQFKGIAATSGAIIAQGFAGTAIYSMRDAIRKELSAEGIVLGKQTGLTHSTLVRFIEPLNNPTELVRAINILNNADLGSFQVDRISFVAHDWIPQENGYATLRKTPIRSFELV